VLRLGLTGGIGSGKSAVASRLADRGAVVIDADLLAREVVAPGTEGLAAVVAAFGPQTLAPDGSLDRAALGDLVFADPAERRRLEAITHPRIGARTADLAAAAERAGTAVLVHDVPLLVEAGLAPAYDVVVVVEAPLAARLDRLAARGLAVEEAGRRIAAQATDEQRRAVADHVLDNSGSLADLDALVARLWLHIAARPGDPVGRPG